MSDKNNKKLGDIIPDKIKNIQVPTNPFKKTHEDDKSSSKTHKKKNLEDTTELPNLEAEIESGAAERYAEEHAGERAANMLRNHEVSEDTMSMDDEYQDGMEDVYNDPTILFNPVDGSSYVNPDYVQEEDAPSTHNSQFKKRQSRPAPQYSSYPSQPVPTPSGNSSDNKTLLTVMVAIIVLLIVAIIAVIVFGVSNHKQSDTTTAPEITMSTTAPTEPSTIYETTRYQTTTTRPTTWTTTTRETTTEDNSFHTDRNGNATWSTRASVEEITPE